MKIKTLLVASLCAAVFAAVACASSPKHPCGNGEPIEFPITDAVEVASAEKKCSELGVKEGDGCAEQDAKCVLVPSKEGQWQGRTVKVIFNTDPGPPGASNVAFDEAVWGAPRIYAKR